MEVTVCIGTFGSKEWLNAGIAAHQATKREHQVSLVHSHRPTLAEARNFAAMKAQTEWLCFLDADDRLAPGYFEAMARAGGDVRVPRVQYVRDGVADDPIVLPARDLRDGNYIVIGALVRRDLFLEIGGFKQWPIYEDWCLWQRCEKAGAKIEQTDAVYVAEVRPESRNTITDPRFVRRVYDEIRQANYPELGEPEPVVA